MMFDRDAREQMIGCRARLQALELCAAISLGDHEAAKDMCETELRKGGSTELATALAQIAVQLARTAADRDGVTEVDLWGLLTEQAHTALIATAEIHELTKNPDIKEENSNDE